MIVQATQVSLLHRLRDADDDQAWWEFDRQYRELILRYSRRCGLQEADAEDVRQLVMMHLARTLPRFEYDPSRGRFRSYLRRAIKNSVNRHMRRPNQTMEGLGSHTEEPESEETQDADWEQEWMLHHYRLAMSTIRESFEEKSLRIFDDLLSGLSIGDAAKKHEISTQAVHKVKQRIRNRLTELIQVQVREEDGLDD